MTLTRQQKRQIERKARAYMAAVDADLVAKLKAERRELMPLFERQFYAGIADDFYRFMYAPQSRLKA